MLVLHAISPSVKLTEEDNNNLTLISICISQAYNTSVSFTRSLSDIFLLYPNLIVVNSFILKTNLYKNNIGGFMISGKSLQEIYDKLNVYQEEFLLVDEAYTSFNSITLYCHRLIDSHIYNQPLAAIRNKFIDEIIINIS